MTSNVGSQDLIDNMKEDGSVDPEIEAQVEGQLRNYFRPEFLNRVDDIITFTPLTREQIKGIIKLQLDEIRERLEGRDITMDVTDAALDYIADEAYEPQYGARPIKRYLSKHVETEIAEGIIRGTIIDGQHLTIDTDGEKLTYVSE
jgi:ATP-dependent Clp protease ATP-binding subunit ClpB